MHLPACGEMNAREDPVNDEVEGGYSDLSQMHIHWLGTMRAAHFTTIDNR